MSLNLELTDIKVDSSLIKRVPYSLAAYYQALPLGYEDGFLSLAIAHPENETALTVLQELLGLAIVPVRVSEASIRDALAHAYGIETASTQKTLAWCASQEDAEAVKQVARTFASESAASHREGRISYLSPDLELETALTVAREGRYNLIVLCPPEAQPLSPLLTGSSASMFFLQPGPADFRRVLMVLRGYSSDWWLLDWLAPLLCQGDSNITLLPLEQQEKAAAQGTFAFPCSSQEHLKVLLHHPALLPGRTTVKFRQGHTVRQVIDEIVQGAYDLVVIAAEGYGDFVGRILCALDKLSPGDLPAVFVGKPPVTPHAG